jgi:hypothetical protein
MKKIPVLLATFVAITSAQAIEGRGAISPDKTRREPPDFHKAMDFYETGKDTRSFLCPICPTKFSGDRMLKLIQGYFD